MNYKNFSKIDKLIGQTANQYNLETALNRHRAIKLWQQVAGAFIEEADKLTQAVDLKKGVLTIACISRQVAAQIKLLAGRIIFALNQMLGKEVVFVILVET